MKMVASEAGGKCKKHPEQEQLPGVCSACLRERLSQLYGCKSQNKAVNPMGVPSCSSSLSSSPPYSSASSSTHVSPNIRGNHHRQASEVTAKIAMVIGGSYGGGLKKSRSIAVVPSGRGGDAKTKKGGFWSKLLRSRGDRSKGAFMHSKGRLD